MSIIFKNSKTNKKKGTWYIDYYDQWNKRHRIRGGDTKAEAVIREGEILDEIKDKRHLPKNLIPDFSEIANEWLQRSSKNLSLGSIGAYKNHVINHLLPYFGKFKMNEITPSLIEQYLDDCLEKMGKSRYMANKPLTTLGTIFTYAKRHNMVNSNPVKDVEKLKTPPHEAEEEDITEENVLNPREIRILLDNTNEKYKPIITTAVLTGMRQGELLALKWGDIDWVNQQIFVRRSLCRAKDENGKPVFNIPKTKKGKRKIDMAPELVNLLKDWRVLQQTKEAIAQATDISKGIQPEESQSKNRYDLVFPNGKGNPDFYPHRSECKPSM